MSRRLEYNWERKTIIVVVGGGVKIPISIQQDDYLLGERRKRYGGS